MREPSAIRLEGVSKTYRLFGSQREQLMEVLGLNRLGLGRGGQCKEFSALTDISLDVPKGARIGVVGRNGAGKTTLLKLICGNFAPSAGSIEVNGTVQALMGTGLGFHPEYTGRENALASLQYNGLGRAEYEAALEDILDFCELDEFIDQPFRTYSLGMQARLMFATSTAIRPDILIVDEVLGAGDGYFIAKSRRRMDRLVNGGCTMLLVSHSTQQVLEMCEEAIWLDHGRIHMQGDAFSVAKSYEEFVHGAGAIYSLPGKVLPNPSPVREQSEDCRDRTWHAQEPELETGQPPIGAQAEPFELHHQARGGISRWQSDVGLKLTGFDLVTDSGSTNELLSLGRAEVVMHLQAERTSTFRCRYGLVVHDHQGRCMTKIFSPLDEFSIEEHQVRRVALSLNPLQLGSGEYVLGISVLDYGPLELLNTARRFDLLGRSFEFKVVVPDSLTATDCNFYHPGEWSFG